MDSHSWIIMDDHGCIGWYNMIYSNQLFLKGIEAMRLAWLHCRRPRCLHHDTPTLRAAHTCHDCLNVWSCLDRFVNGEIWKRFNVGNWCNQKARPQYRVTETNTVLPNMVLSLLPWSSGLRHRVSSSSSASRDRASVRSTLAHALMLALYTIASRSAAGVVKLTWPHWPFF